MSVREKTVREIMTPRSVLFMVDGDMLISDIIKEKNLYAHSRVPVYLENPDEIVGVVHRRDLLVKVADGKDSLKLRSIMKPVNFVLATTTLDVLLKLFLKKRQHLFVALNEFNDPCGVVTLEDVIEEILGSEIVDEFDETVDMQQLARQKRSELTTGTKKK